jgi:hypothetical protein
VRFAFDPAVVQVCTCPLQSVAGNVGCGFPVYSPRVRKVHLKERERREGGGRYIWAGKYNCFHPVLNVPRQFPRVLQEAMR